MIAAGLLNALDTDRLGISMVRFRGALIVCGFFAKNHMHAWHSIDDVEIVAVCDSNADRLVSMGSDFGVSRRFADAAALFEEGGFDFVDIATTSPSHYKLIELAAKRRIPVICQKPLATSFTQAQEIIHISAEAGIKLMVHENFRWQSPIRRVDEIVRSGAIGKPFWARFSFRSGYDIYANQPYLTTGHRLIIEDLGVHILDIARSILGEVTSLSATKGQVNPRIAGEDFATMLLNHASGATSVVDVSYATSREPDTFPETLLEIDGDGGSLQLLPGYRLHLTSGSTSKEMDVAPQLLPWATRPWHNVQESVLSIQKHWIDCLREGVEPSTSGADNIKTLALVEAAYEGANTGKTVFLQS